MCDTRVSCFGPGTEPDNGKARAISCMGEGVVGGIARPCNYPWVELKGEGCIDRSFLCPAWADKGACKNYWYYSFMQSYCCNSCAAYFGYYTGIYARMRYDPQLYYKLLMAALKQQGGVTPGVGMGMMGQQGLYQGGMGMVGQQGLYPGGMGIAGQQGLYQGGMGVLGQGGMYGRGLMMGLMKKKK